jgi:hypothetical protein
MSIGIVNGWIEDAQLIIFQNLYWLSIFNFRLKRSVEPVADNYIYIAAPLLGGNLIEIGQNLC